MNLLKTTLLSIILFAFAASAQAQSGNYIHISAQTGFVVNSAHDRKLGLGGNAAFLLSDKLIDKNQKNFWTFSIKAFNNPIEDGEFFSSFNNKEYDAFNYVGLLAGYRYTLQGMQNGFYAEPRLGYGVLASGRSAFLFAPVVGYTYNNIDFALFCDMGFSGNKMTIQKNQFITLGLSVGYNIGI